jgi:hypothetical protein
MKVIGIAGKKRHGKDTFGEMLAKHLGGKVFRFADELKREVSLALSVSIPVIEENKEVFRPILQWWGTEFRRKFSGLDGYWINILERDITEIALKEAVQYAVVTDVRFKNEIKFIQTFRGILIKVERPNVDEGDMHISENDLNEFKDWDKVVVNCGTLEDLDAVAKTIANEIK